jgi:cytochrome c2
MRRSLIAVLFISGVLAVGPAQAEDQADAATLKLGQRVFLLCRSCHTTEEGGGPRVGPNLWHVFGRKAGSTDYRYSDAR